MKNMSAHTNTHTSTQIHTHLNGDVAQALDGVVQIARVQDLAVCGLHFQTHNE